MGIDMILCMIWYDIYGKNKRREGVGLGWVSQKRKQNGEEDKKKKPQNNDKKKK